MPTSLAALERKFNDLQTYYLLLRIAQLEALLAEKQQLGMYEVAFDLRKMTPEERLEVRAILVNVENRETGKQP